MPKNITDTTGVLAVAAVAASEAVAGIAWDLKDLVDNHLSGDPCAVLTVSISLGDGSPYATYNLQVFDGKESDIVVSNPDGGLWGLFRTSKASLETAYTDVTNAFYDATGRKTERLLAAMDVIENLGIVSLEAKTVTPIEGGGGSEAVVTP